MSRRSGNLQFFGVTTGSSMIVQVFPSWAQLLGLDARLEGVDLPLHAPRGRYRGALRRLRDDPEAAGALVTSHKLDLIAAAGDLFDHLDPLATLCREVSCISKGPAGELLGHAKDPITSGLALAAFVPAGYWRGGAEVLCLGAGGAAVAISLHLAGLDDPPRRYRITDVRRDRLEHLRALHGRLESPVAFEYLLADPGGSEALLASLPPGSLVINATGLGKDRPGSPLGDGARFPERGLIWELNYRGDLAFWHQAQAQREARQLVVEDGWVYFLHGWSQVIAEVYGLTLTPELFTELDRAAAPIRPQR